MDYEPYSLRIFSEGTEPTDPSVAYIIGALPKDTTVLDSSLQPSAASTTIQTNVYWLAAPLVVSGISAL